jgi:hypothetical protein
MHSNLSRDELGYLLSVCEQQHEPFRKLFEALGTDVIYCAEPGCLAMTCGEARVNCTSMKECDLMETMACVGDDKRYGWCDAHAKTGLWTVTKQCQLPSWHPGCTSHREPWLICKYCKAETECELEYTQDHAPYIFCLE